VRKRDADRAGRVRRHVAAEHAALQPHRGHLRGEKSTARTSMNTRFACLPKPGQSPHTHAE
jgi:hypothetical protein